MTMDLRMVTIAAAITFGAGLALAAGPAKAQQSPQPEQGVTTEVLPAPVTPEALPAPSAGSVVPNSGTGQVDEPMSVMPSGEGGGGCHGRTIVPSV